MPEHKIQVDSQNTRYIPNDMTMLSGTTFTAYNLVVISGSIIMPYEYFVYKTSGNVTNIINQSGQIQYSGIDTGAVVNSMLSGCNSDITIGFQANEYSGATNIQNNGRANVKWYGNSARIGMKIKINSSGNVLRAGYNVFDSFHFSGTGAGMVLDNVFAPRLQNCKFDGCIEGISFESTNKWTEFWNLSNIHFNNCVKSMIFKSGGVHFGAGSYVNGLMDLVTFNTAGVMTTPFTFMEVQKTAELSEGIAIDTRWWFNDPSGIGIHMQSGSAASRFKLVKPYFESFGGTAGTTVAILLEPSTGTFWLDGRPVFAGGGGFAHKILNSGNTPIAGPVSNWRQATAVSIPATINTFSSSTTVISNINDDFEGVPNMFVVVGGTFVAGESVTAEITSNALGTGGTAATFTVTKTYAFTGTYPLEVTDYTTFASNSYRYVIDTITTRVKSSVANSTVTIQITGFAGGGSFQPNPKLSGLIWLGATTSGQTITNGAATATTTNPRGYLQINVSGNNVQIPYYA